jgi:hypothetical protein
MKRALPLALLFATACTGSVADGPPNRAGGTAPGGQTPGAPGGSGPGTPPVATLPAGSACTAQDIPRARTWRLTNAQFKNTAKAVFGFTGPTAELLPPDAQPEGFANQADRLSVQPLLASKYVLATDEIASNVVSRSGEFIKCPLAGLGTGTCLADFLNGVGTRAWRRPLTPAEVTKYTTLYGTIAAANTPDVAFKGVVQALMLSPNFLFRTELGSGTGATTALTDYELASALSYMLLDGPPDPGLMQLAATGKLRDPATLGREAKRLLGVAQSAKIVGSFFQQWLQFDTLPSMSKDADLFPVYTPDVVNDLLGENQAFLDGVLFDPAGDHSVKTLLTASYGYVNSRTAPLYGVQQASATLVKTDLPAKERRGLLTEAAFIAGVSDPDDTNLPSRGRVVREQMLCEWVAPPPGNFSFDESKITPDMTNREKFSVHTTNPACASCHTLFDGIGFAMEQYDPIGRFRTMDKNKTIDPSGDIPLTKGSLKFGSYVEFIDQISQLPETYQCVATQYNAYATGRAPTEIAACEAGSIGQAFASGGYKVDALVSAIVTSPTFALRRN